MYNFEYQKIVVLRVQKSCRKKFPGLKGGVFFIECIKRL